MKNPAQPNSRLHVLILLLLLSAVMLFAGYAWTSQYNPFNPNISFTTGKSRRVLNFTEFFITSVLQADGSVDIKTQTELEDRLRDLGDKDVSAAWEKLIAADNEETLQKETSSFLLLLTQKARGELNK